MSFSRKTRNRPNLLARLLLAVSCLITATTAVAAAEDIELFRTYSGNIDYIAAGASFRDTPNATNSCSFVNPMSTDVIVNIPANAVVLEAFLYFAGSGSNTAPVIDIASQSGLTLNGIAVSTGAGGDNENYELIDVIGGLDFFAARRDVTNIVTGPGSYTFAGLEVHRTPPNGDRTNNGTCLGAWSVVVVYQDPAVSNIRVINLFDGFQAFQNILAGFPLEPRNFVLRTGAAGKVTHVTYEGDDSLGAGSGGACGTCTERFTLQVPSGGTENNLTNPLNPLTNQFNGTVTGPDVFDSDTSYGLDLDTYNIDTILSGAAGEYSAQTRYYAAQDLVILQAEIFVVENKPLADIEIDVSNVGSFVENSTGQYRISVTNNGDGTGNTATGNATDFIQVFADLPTGITFSSFSAGSWTCDATAATTNNRIRCSYDVTPLTAGEAGLDAFESLEDILINVNIADIATTGATADMSGWAFSCDDATLSTNAIINDGSMSGCDSFDEKHSSDLAQFDNRGFFEVSDVSYFGLTTKSAANNNVQTLSVNILSNTESDLSTSTKTATDLNGGDLNVGDTLEYQITINETAGNATVGGVVLTDLIDTDTTYVFGSLVVTGSSYTVISTGSTLELEGLVIPALSSIIITFRVTVDTGTAGQTIENTVSLSNANGPDATAAITTQFVTIDNQVGNKPLYLDFSGTSPNFELTRTIPTSDSSSGVVDRLDTIEFDLPAINNSLTLLSRTVPLTLWIENENPASPNSGDITIDVRLLDDGVEIGTATQTFQMAQNAQELVPFPITPNPANTSPLTLTTGDILTVEVTNNSANAADDFSIHSRLTTVSSSLVIDSQDVISIDAAFVLSGVKDATCTTPITVNVNPGDNICIEAVVSDPFGEYDIQPTGNPSLIITDPDSLSTYTATLTTVAGVTDDEITYQWAFAIPASGVSLGQWNVGLTVDEGDEGSISDSATTSFQTANEPDLSSSVKSVVNIDNAVSRPGDTLRYTITLTETNGGAASGVSVLDYIPPATNNLSIISFPAGAINASSTTVIDISNITVPANSSVSIVFEVNISLGTPIGTRIDNTAEIDEPVAGDIDIAAPSIFVYGAPSNGSKLLYLDELGSTNELTRDEDESDANGDLSDIDLDGLGASVTIVQTPPTATPLTLNAGPINVNVWLNRNNKGGAEPRVMEFQLGYQSATGGGGSTGIIDTETISTVLGDGAGNASLITTVLDLASDTVLNANTEVFLRITNNTPANVNREITVSSILNSIPSTVELDAETVINVDSITVYDDSGAGGSAGLVTTTPAAGDTIHIQAIVSDPFGEADIQPNGNPVLVLTDPDTATVNPNTTNSYESETTLTEIDPDGNLGTRTYNWEFTIPNLPAPPTQGTWGIQVTADEGDEGTIANTAAVVFNTDSISDLSQSTKSVVDKFGGETEPGDVLVYTITLVNDTDITANNVSVNDFLNANLGSLGSITFPVGATNNSTLVTGPLSINNIVVPDNTTDLGDGLGTAIITFEVTLDAAAQPGDLVNNTAGINNPAGIGANPAAQTLIVSPSLIPSTGNKILYIDTSGTDALSRNATIPNSSVTIAEQGGTITFAIDESLKKDLTLEAGPIPVSLWLSSSESNNKSRQIDVDLSYSGTSTGTIGSQTQSMNLNGTETQTDFYIDLASQITLLAGTSINLTVTNNIANNNRDADISSDTGPNPDEVNTIQLNASTVINVDSVDVYDAAFGGGSIVTTIIPPNTVFIRAVVSDPFGGFDINPNCILSTPSVDCPSISLTGPVDDVDNGNMTLVDDPSPDDGTRTFEYSFVLPSLAAEAAGQWDISITANEGTEDTVEHTAFGSFSTENIPNLSTSLKSVVDKFGGEADAGDVLIYSIDIYETGGSAATGISVTDSLPANLTYVPATLIVCQDSTAPLDDCSETATFSGDFTGSNLALTGLTVPAGGWVQVQFEATIDGGAMPGDLVDNTVSITNPNGPGIVTGAPTLTVSPSQIGNAGAKDIYLVNLDSALDLTRIDPLVAGSDTTVHLDGGEATSLDLTPATVRPLTLGSGPIPVYLAINGDNKNNRTRDIQLTLSYSGGSTGTVGSDSTSVNLSNNTGTIVVVPFSIDLASDLTLDAGTILSLSVANNSDANRELDIHSFDTGFASKIQLNSNTVVNVDSVDIYNAAFPAGSIVTSREPGEVAYIRAVVSDPFGAFDINPDCPLTTVDPDCPAITVTGPTDAGLTTTMQLVDDPAIDDGTRTYEYQYTVPAEGTGAGDTLEERGAWGLSVTANEGTEGTISHTAVANFSTANDPDLSTSEKSVVDKFGGDADPGDVLVYTINIFETGGSSETGVTITDTLPVNTTYVPGSLSLCQDVSAPLDNCVDPVISTGDVIGGVLSLTDVTVPADSLVSIEFEVTINGGAQPGDFVDNSATIYNPNGPGAGVQAPSIIVSLSQIGNAGAKNLYLENLDGSLDLTRTLPTADTEIHLDGGGDSTDLTLSAATEKELTLGSGPISGQLYLNGDNKNGTRVIDVTLGYSGPSTGTIGSDSISISLTNNTGNILAAPFSIDLASDLVLPLGTLFNLNVTNNSGNANREIDLHSFPSTGNYSLVGLNSNTVINIDSFEIYDDSFANGGGSITSSATEAESLFLRAVVSDPYGAFDINPLCAQNSAADANCPSIAFTGPDDDIPTGFMTRLDDNTADGEHIFEYEFVVPAFASEPEGQWDVTMTTQEGTEGTIDHSANSVFFTNDIPDVSTSTKTVVDLNAGDVEPGDTLQYTITIIESNDAAATISIFDVIDVNTTNLVITDNGSGTTNGAAPADTVDISAIPVTASGSVDVVFTVDVDAGLAPGTLLNNSASVINPDGPSGSATAETLIVSESQLASLGDKSIYLDFNTDELSRTQPTAFESTIAPNGTLVMDLTAPLTDDLTIAAGDITLFLWAYKSGALDNRSINAQLSYTGTSSGTIDDDSVFVALGDSLATATKVPFVLSVPSDLTLLAGTTLRLTLSNQTAAAGEDLEVASLNTGEYSELRVPLVGSIEVATMQFFDISGTDETGDPGCSPVCGIEINAAQINNGDSIWVRATITDPFGSFDVNTGCDGVTSTNCPTVQVTDPDSTVTNTVLAFLNAPNTSSRIFEFELTATVIADGTYTIEIVGAEGVENVLFDTGVITFDVLGDPVLDIIKDAVGEAGTTNPGDIVLYTVTVTNNGDGPATEVTLTNTLGDFSTLILIDNGGTWTAKHTLTVGYTIETESFDNGNDLFDYDPNTVGVCASAGSPCEDPTIEKWRIVLTEDVPVSDVIVEEYRARID